MVVDAVRLERNRVLRNCFDLVQVLLATCHSTLNAQPVTVRVDHDVVFSEGVETRFADSHATVVATVLFGWGHGLQVSWVHTVVVSTSVDVDVIDGQTIRDGSNPQLVGIPVCQDSFRFASFTVGEVSSSTFGNFAFPEPACVCLVDLSNEEFVSGETPGQPFARGERISILPVSLVMSAAEIKTADRILTPGDYAGHDSDRTRSGDYTSWQ